jgi:hypothetical protein
MKRHAHHLHERTPILSVGRNPMAKRRSARMALHAAVGLSGEDLQKAAFTIMAKATNLNKHGAAVHLYRELPVGSTVVVRNQRGAEIPARVVAQISAIDGLRTYGIEFIKHDERSKQFWGISFPSA